MIGFDIFALSDFTDPYLSMDISSIVTNGDIYIQWGIIDSSSTGYRCRVLSDASVQPDA